MQVGFQQIYQHITLWSQIPQALTLISPMDAASLASTPKGIVENLNRYMREMRLQEIGLQKALRINPDELKVHLEKDLKLFDFFLHMSPRLDWVTAHPNLALTIDDLHQMRMSIFGAKRRLNAWSRRPTAPRPAGLEEHLKWLQGSTRARSEMARLAVQLGEPENSIRQFYDEKTRRTAGVTTIEESLKVYFQIGTRPR
jgi:hypothetical protein